MTTRFICGTHTVERLRTMRRNFGCGIYWAGRIILVERVGIFEAARRDPVWASTFNRVIP